MLLDPRANQRVKIVTRWVCGESAILPQQMNFFYPYGGEKVIFTKDEVLALKTIDSQGLRLMGFKPLDSLKSYHSYKSSSFIYPDERAVKGSTAAFAALWEKMLEKKKMAIARLTPRANSAPRFVALVRILFSFSFCLLVSVVI